MIQVRKNVFETNSSSTHSMVIAMASDFDKWENGELLVCDNFPYKADKSLEKDSNFYTKEEVEAILKSAGIKFDSDERTWYFRTYDEWCDTEYLEVDENSFTTPNGETIRTICKYGYDG